MSTWPPNAALRRRLRPPLVSWGRRPHAPDPPVSRARSPTFHPDKIILFGSYAYGTPHADSDVDILVVMPCRNELDQAVRIDLAVEAPVPA